MSPSTPNAANPALHRNARQKVAKGEKEEKNFQKRKFNSHVKVACVLRKERNFISLCTFRREGSKNPDGKVRLQTYICTYMVF